MRPGQTTLIVFLSKLLGSALGFLATIYFARVLGAEIIGYYSLVLALMLWLVILGDTGLSAAMTKRISEGEEPNAYFTASALMIGSLGVITAAVVVIFSEYVDAYVGETIAGFLAVIIFVKLLYQFTSAALNGERKVHISGILQPIQIGTHSLFQIALIIVGFQLVGLLVGYIIGGIVAGSIGFWYLSVGFERPRIRHFKSLLQYAKYAWLGRLKARSFNDVDILILGFFVSPALVGVYAVAWSIATFLNLFGGAVSSTLFTELSKADVNDNRDAVRGFIEDSLTYGGLFVIPGLLGGALLGERLLRIYGPEFTQGVTVFVLLIAATLLYGYQTQLLNALNGIDRPDLAFRINAVFVLANIVLNVVLIWAIGFVGAAIATAISAGVGLVLSFGALRSIVTFRIPYGEVVRQVVAALSMSVVVYAGLLTFDAIGVTHNVAIVVTLVAVGAGVYFLALLAISATFRATVRANSPVEVPALSK